MFEAVVNPRWAPIVAYVLFWWAAHFVTQLLTSRAIHDGAQGIFILFATFGISAAMGSVGADATDAKIAFGSDAAPNVAFCLQVSNLAGNLLMYNSMMHIPAHCSHSVKALEVVITTILAW